MPTKKRQKAKQIQNKKTFILPPTQAPSSFPLSHHAAPTKVMVACFVLLKKIKMAAEIIASV